MRTRRPTALALCITLVLSACGDDDPAPADEPPAEGSDSAPDATSEPATITIADFAFDGVTEVPVGTTVIVTNTDTAQHTWSAVDGAFDSGALGEGDTFEFTFTEPGTFDYQCNFHPSMTGTIVVS